MTTIKARIDLFHDDGTRSFTKGKEYTTDKQVFLNSSLMDCITHNDQGRQHRISVWCKHFTIVYK